MSQQNSDTAKVDISVTFKFKEFCSLMRCKKSRFQWLSVVGRKLVDLFVSLCLLNVWFLLQVDSMQTVFARLIQVKKSRTFIKMHCKGGRVIWILDKYINLTI